MVRRNGRSIIPKGNLVIRGGDTILIYEKHLTNENIRI